MINRLKTQRKFGKQDLTLQKTTARSPANSKSPLSTYTRRLCTPTTERYSKHSSKSPLVTRYRQFFRTETQSPSNNQPDSLLSQIKSRRTPKNPQKPSAHLAQSVLKLYFLPFFQEQHKLDTDKRRLISYGNSPKPKPKPFNTFKPLGKILQDLLNKENSELAVIKSKLASVQQEKSKMKTELNSLKTSKFTLNINLNSLSSDHSLAYAPTQSLISVVCACQSEKVEFFKAFTENAFLKKTLTTEKWNNEDLKSESVQSKFHNNEYYLINQITGESLKGAYYSISALKNPAITENFLYSVQVSLKNSRRVLVQKNDSSLGIFSVLLADREKYLELSKSITKQRASVWKELRSLKTTVSSYLENLMNTMKTSHTHKKKIFEEFEIREKEFFKFIEDYKSAQFKLEEMQRARRGERPELMCRFCSKDFFEEDNFNWSCCSHPSEWSGTMYWCCGAKEKSSVGCFKRRHEEQNNEVEEGEAEKEGNLLFLEYKKEETEVKFCTGCKKTGHCSSECEKDPNRVRVLRSGTNNNKEARKSGKTKVLEVNRSLSSRNLWVKSKQKSGNESFEDIKEIKRLASRNVTPEHTIHTQTSARNVFSSPSRTLALTPFK